MLPVQSILQVTLLEYSRTLSELPLTTNAPARRVPERKTSPTCPNSGICLLNPSAVKHCSGCRLQKCLRWETSKADSPSCCCQCGDGAEPGADRGPAQGEVLPLPPAKASSQADGRGGRRQPGKLDFNSGRLLRIRRGHCKSSKTGDKDSPSEIPGRKKIRKSAKGWV